MSAKSGSLSTSIAWDREKCLLYGVAGCPLFRGCLSIEVNGRAVGTFRTVRYTVDVRYSGVSVKQGSTVVQCKASCEVQDWFQSSLSPRPPPFLPSFCVHNNTRERISCIIVNVNGRSKRGRPGTEASTLNTNLMSWRRYSLVPRLSPHLEPGNEARGGIHDISNLSKHSLQFFCH